MEEVRDLSLLLPTMVWFKSEGLRGLAMMKEIFVSNYLILKMQVQYFRFQVAILHTKSYLMTMGFR